jgi:hypothetical protein
MPSPAHSVGALVVAIPECWVKDHSTCLAPKPETEPSESDKVCRGLLPRVSVGSLSARAAFNRCREVHKAAVRIPNSKGRLVRDRVIRRFFIGVCS